jgi:hypothetical protein
MIRSSHRVRAATAIFDAISFHVWLQAQPEPATMMALYLLE